MGASTIKKVKNATIWLRKYIGALFLVITPLILIALDCYDVPAHLGCNPIIKYKSLIYIAIGLYYSVIIYISQNNSANRQCNLIVEHIKQLDGIKPHEIKEECLKWLQNTEKDTHFICFYFPYSLVPCFWVDITMNNQIIQKLRTLSCEDNLKLMFIGPSMETKNFKKFFNKVALGVGVRFLPVITEEYKRISIVNRRNRQIGRSSILTKMDRLLSPFIVSVIRRIDSITLSIVTQQLENRIIQYEFSRLRTNDFIHGGICILFLIYVIIYS